MEDAIIQAVDPMTDRATELLLYLSDQSTGVLRGIGMLSERKAAGLPVRTHEAEDAVCVARKLADPSGQLASGLARRIELVRSIGIGLLPPNRFEELR